MNWEDTTVEDNTLTDTVYQVGIWGLLGEIVTLKKMESRGYH